MLNIFSGFSKCLNGTNVYGICRFAFVIANPPPPPAARSLEGAHCKAVKTGLKNSPETNPT